MRASGLGYQFASLVKFPAQSSTGMKRYSRKMFSGCVPASGYITPTGLSLAVKILNLKLEYVIFRLKKQRFESDENSLQGSLAGPPHLPRPGPAYNIVLIFSLFLPRSPAASWGGSVSGLGSGHAGLSGGATWAPAAWTSQLGHHARLLLLLPKGPLLTPSAFARALLGA